MSARAALPEPEQVPRLTPDHLPPGKLTVVVFGPGHGEAVLVGLPDGRLGVLDGCAEHEDPVRALLDQLDEHRPDPPRLAFLGLTHPHEDHYAGLGRLMKERFDRVDLWLDTPLGNRHAKALYKFLESREAHQKAIPSAAKLKTIEQIVQVMDKVVREVPARFREPRSDRLLLSTECAGYTLRLTGIGPADSDIRRAQTELARAIRALAQGKKPTRGPDPNLQSAALVLRWGQAGVLLTGDLLNGQRSYLGWTAAVEAHALNEGPIQVIKCAHHASEGAHHPGLWEHLRPGLALVTPFKHGQTDRQGAKMPPQPDQLDRIAQQCPVVITTPPRWSRPSTAAAGLGLKNDVLELTPAPGRAALQNAVAVSLNPDGTFHRITLAGEAHVYTAHGAAGPSV